ncbi:MAG TPA: signal peptidase I [Nitrospinota bacterium]|nr:signal peptidase I [Nitrospinota bacterium]
MKKKTWVRELIESIIIALILALIIRTFVIQAFKIPSGSMLPTLQIGDHILVSKFIYRFKDPQRGDIIVFKFPGDEKRDFIKRLIGLPNEEVEVKNNQVFINNKPLHEPYAIYEEDLLSKKNYGPYHLPDGHLFVMGDNRDNSLDSRAWGFLDKNKIKGKAWRIYWSWDKKNYGVRWKRIGKLLK